jgi:hypothetical protein
MQPAHQGRLFAALFGASLVGPVVAVVWRGSRIAGAARRLALVALAVAAWRVSYFPIMVFSGHVASIGEWLLVGTRVLPVVIYPTFLLSVATLHALASLAASWILEPPLRPLRWAALAAFTVASLVSFSTLQDLRPLPDTGWQLGDPVPPPRSPERNPYLRNLTAPGYAPPQRLLLLAAGLTYATIPGTPWADTVKGVLEGQFEANPFAPSRSRVAEHYLAYRSAHARIGCRNLADCPTAQGAGSGQGAGVAPR